MICRLCGTEYEGEACPNCGTPMEEEITGLQPEAAEEIDPIDPIAPGGIFYEALAASHALGEEEKTVEKKPRTYEKRDLMSMLLLVLLLLVYLGGIWLYSARYDPDARALTGADGVAMSNGVYAVFYMSAYSSYLSDNSDAIYFDTSRPLSRQYYNAEAGYSWEDYFLESAMTQAAATACLFRQAEKEGMALDSEDLAEIDDTISSLEDYAAGYGLDGLQGYLDASYSGRIRAEDYREYLIETALAQKYAETIYNAAEFDEDTVRDYYSAHMGDYTDYMDYGEDIVLQLVLSDLKSEAMSEGITALMQSSDCRLTRFAAEPKAA